jgi:predicted outer membrane repeat protein
MQTVEEISIRPEVTLDAPVLINNTIAYNRATVNGGAISTSGAWTPKVINTIAWGDTGTTEIALFGGSGIRVLFSDIQGGWPSDFGNIADSIRFVPGDTLYNLQAASPCIGRGIDSIQVDGIWYHAPAYDFDGDARHRPPGPQSVDIGAQEEQITVDVAIRELPPPSYVLEQNYPNPFNPTTTILYGLPTRSQVTLTVFNTIGQQVAQFQNGEQEAGYHEVRFEANGLSSGVYFYRIQAGDFVETRRLILLQ